MIIFNQRKNDKTTSLDPLCGVLAFVSHPCHREDFFIGACMKLISITKGKFAMVDDEDYEWINQWSWYCDKEYAARWISGGNGRASFMYGDILKTPDGLFTDHIDHNGLNNQKYNLRVVTNAQNQMNRKSNKHTSSIFKGVYWHKKDKRWQAGIGLDGKRIYLGNYKSEVDAAKTYDLAAIELFGEFAHTNF